MKHIIHGGKGMVKLTKKQMKEIGGGAPAYECEEWLDIICCTWMELITCCRTSWGEEYCY
jgi:hypothetical protein